LPDNSKDVVIAVFGASVALAGLLLVFIGFVFSQAANFPPETTDDKVIRRYEMAGKLGIIPFVLSLSDAALGLWWLLAGSPRVYASTVSGFFLLLVLTALYGVWLIVFYL
jgi:hypothetical protein